MCLCVSCQACLSALSEITDIISFQKSFILRGLQGRYVSRESYTLGSCLESDPTMYQISSPLKFLKKLNSLLTTSYAKPLH
jgi:hypothetical protein